MPVAVPKTDYFAVLDLAHDATEDEIRVAYKKLALKWHPDRHQENKDEAQEKFVEIKDAYIHLLEEFEKQRRRKARKEKPASSAASDASSMRAPSSAPSECASEAPSAKPEPERKEMRKHKEPRKEDKPSPPADPPSDRPKTRPHSDETPKKSASNPQSTPKPTRATLKKSSRQHPDRHEHGNRRSEQDDSSDDEPTRRKKSSHPHRSPHHLEETDYEFVDLADLGTPLHPLRNPKPKESKESGSHDKDWTFPLPLTLEELYRCSSQHYRITRTLRSGKTQSVKIDIRVSPRWTTGTEVRVPGVGNERTDGTFQDIVFVVEELPHPRFTRSGDDLLLSVQVPWADSHPRPYSSSSDCTDDDNAAFSQEEEEEVYVKALDGEEYALPIPRSLVEAADGSRVVGAGMPIRKNGKRIGKGDLIIKWDFVFPDAERGQKLRWHTLKKAMHWKR